MPASDTLQFPPSSRPFLDPYLPPLSNDTNEDTPTSQEQKKKDGLSRPFTTLTFATSLDSALSLAPGVRTVLSGPHSKAMTHYLRFRHDAILIGVGTANADDPGLNCRIEGAGGYAEEIPADDNDNNNTQKKGPAPDPVIQALTEGASSDPELKNLMKVVAMSQSSPEQREIFQSHLDRISDKHAAEEAERIRRQQKTLHQPRPIVVDPKASWVLHERSKIIQLVKQGKGKAPYVLVSKTTSPPQKARDILEKYGGKYIALDPMGSSGDDACPQHFDWNTILDVLYTQEKITSLMIEGGGSIINSLLSEQRYSGLIDSVIVTIAPTWLGQGGVVVSPNRRVDENGCAIPASRLTDVKWYPFGEDVVLCGRILRS
jgi:2,5-diamino-6-(ribosylamino)-4(3H)-pyrimidinone 5'-phosphate reductase